MFAAYKRDNRYIKATVVYRCSLVITRLRENKSGLQTQIEGNSSTIRGNNDTKKKHSSATKKLKRDIQNQS